MATKELLGYLHDVASNPAGQMKKYLDVGKEVVLCAPIYTPMEIIHSMGLVPMGVWGADMEIVEAKKYYPAFICSIMQTIVELGIKGSYKGASAIIIPSLCDSLKALGQNWKYAVEDIPFVPMSYPQNRKPVYGIKFIKNGYERVINDLTIATHGHYSDFALQNSNAIYNEHNAVMREFSEISAEAQISAQERNDVFKSAWFMLPEEHTKIVKALNGSLQNGPRTERKIRVMTTGILADAPNLLRIFDENNLQIVADDIAHESRKYRTDIPNDEQPLDALARKFADMDNCSVLYDPKKGRVDYIIDEAKKHRAQGVIVLMTKFCDPEEFDYVPIKGACDANNLPHINIEVDRQMVNYQQAGTMIQGFKEMF